MSGALRETQEELGIDPAQVEVLGEIGPPETNLRGDMIVWPFVASFLTQNFKMILCSNADNTGFCSLGLSRKPCS
jgi:8-oxo-dGTP pyrophosphatase MutT (NUDIX family)